MGPKPIITYHFILDVIILFLDVKDKSSVVVSTASNTKVIPNVLYIPNISQNLLSAREMLENDYSLLSTKKANKTSILTNQRMEP